ncbi:nuclear transport factor 2 family protein [Streptomyces sp. NRRL B-24572]|uniref:nuclear transport factor 2 family protein n=1 Tax=Streptomyces sp. NRRL B-24572 TaxID=1962156 RepID=UPI000A3665F1|nr:nuclear transport factor 2 family protein [Streptomyces sp. NRRL B-24572]
MTHHEHPDAALVRRGYEAFSKGDMETMASLLTSDCTYHSPGSTRFGGHFKGRDNVLAHFRDLSEYTGGTLRTELEGVFPDGRGHVIATHKWYAEHGDRGIEMRGGLFFTLIGGKASDIDECVEDIEEADAFMSLDD